MMLMPAPASNCWRTDERAGRRQWCSDGMVGVRSGGWTRELDLPNKQAGVASAGVGRSRIVQPLVPLRSILPCMARPSVCSNLSISVLLVGEPSAPVASIASAQRNFIGYAGRWGGGAMKIGFAFRPKAGMDPMYTEEKD